MRPVPHWQRSASPLRLVGFTLIELLVVLAIILVLAGILIPVISTVRNQAQQANCAGRLRQTYMAIIAYRTDFQVLPKVEGGMALIYPHVSAAIATPNLPNLLKDYADGNLMIFYCPRNAQSRTPATHWPNATTAQYSMTYQLMSWAKPALPNFLVAIPDYRQANATTLLLSDFCASTDNARKTGAVWNHDNGGGIGAISGMNACYGDGHVVWQPGSGKWTNWYKDPSNGFYWWALGW